MEFLLWQLDPKYFIVSMVQTERKMQTTSFQDEMQKLMAISYFRKNQKSEFTTSHKQVLSAKGYEYQKSYV